MKLWKLQPCNDQIANDDEYFPHYVAMYEILVRSETEESARKFAAAHSAKAEMYGTAESPDVWLNSAITSCMEISPEGDEAVIMTHVADG